MFQLKLVDDNVDVMRARNHLASLAFEAAEVADNVVVLSFGKMRNVVDAA